MNDNIRNNSRIKYRRQQPILKVHYHSRYWKISTDVLFGMQANVYSIASAIDID